MRLTMPNIILVGEDNPHSIAPRHALYPLPVGSAGGRLCRLIMEMDPKTYIRRFQRVNLCGSGRWSAASAREHADIIRLAAWDNHSTLVLLGAKVCHAFGIHYAPFTSTSDGRSGTFGKLTQGIGGCAPMPAHVILPHPSGRSRAWNEPDALERARSTLRDAGVLP